MTKLQERAKKWEELNKYADELEKRVERMQKQIRETASGLVDPRTLSEWSSFERLRLSAVYFVDDEAFKADRSVPRRPVKWW